MTENEKRIRDSLPEALRKMAEVSLDYSRVLSHVNSKLKEIYGDRADWNNCINAYERSQYYNSSCRDAKRIEDIPEISHEDIMDMIEDEKKSNLLMDELLSLREFAFVNNKELPGKEFYRVADILGFLPDSSPSMLNNWMVDKTELTEVEKEDYGRKIQDNVVKLGIAVSLMIDFYNEGMEVSFPYEGTLITQRKSKYFYRGENAFYGTSKPSINRAYKSTIPKKVYDLVGLLRLNEGCSFLNNFDAVKYWNISNVSYVALAQHYGLKTIMMDVTSDLMTALFFACCKFGKDGKWHPLKELEIRNRDSRLDIKRLNGDSRYGILYRMPTEIVDMQWIASDIDKGNMITPIGYQPFMRCSNQYGYMFIPKNKDYDMMRDKMFEKMKFRLTEDFCCWVYDEMEQGNKVYPNDDVPDISVYMDKINNTHRFSRSIYELVTTDWHLTDEGKCDMEKALSTYGYHVDNGDISWITYHQLQKINKRYSAEKARELANVVTKTKALIML